MNKTRNEVQTVAITAGAVLRPIVLAAAALGVFAIAHSPAVASAQGEDALTLEHVARLRMVTAAEVSPDGSHIAQLLSVPREPFADKSGSPWSELHVIDPGGSSRPFITREVNVSSVAWTPDGKGISFRAKRGKDEHRSLYVIPLDGGEARQILTHETGVGSYSWSPDGSHVAFLATQKRHRHRKNLEDKGFNQEVFEEDLQHRYVRVWIGAVDDEDVEPRMLDLPGSASALYWSPDGSHLAVALAPTPLIDDEYMKRKMHVVDVESGKIVTRLDTPGKIEQLSWSPDGRRLAMITAEDLHDPGPGRLMVAAVLDQPLRDVLPGYLGHVSSIAWQDNDTVMYLGDEGVWTMLGEIRFDGTGKKTHVPVGRSVLSRLRLSRDGLAAVMLGNAVSHPTEAFVMRHGDAGPRRLTDSNPWLADLRLGRQEAVSYKARDGLTIDGVLIRPVDEQAGKRYPLIVVVHGGPEGHRRNGWLTRYSSPGQVAAGRGYAVFFPNYRASTGRGVDFSKLDHGDFAGTEFDDLVDGVDHLIEMGLVDRDRVGVTGGSYGGYATGWCATYYSERFAAGVMFVGISDYLSKIGTTDIPNEMVLVHTRKHVWEDWDLYLSRSPIRYVEKARTPLLIMHGKADTRVNPAQSLELYRHLKTLGQTPVRLVWYPGEGHGNRKSAGRYDYSRRMMRWFDHYLKGPGGDPPPFEIDYGFDLSDDEEEGDDD